MASLLSKLAPKGHAGLIFMSELRYGYGTQSHIEKMEIIHKWYSNLRAYLPEKFKEKGIDEEIKNLLNESWVELEAAWNLYDPSFEGLDTCNPQEKEFVKALWGVFQRLDLITAKAKIIEDMKADENYEEMTAG